MTEMEFYEGKKEDSQIQYSMMRRKTTQEGMVTHVMDICQLRKKSIEVANENDHRWSLNFGASASEYHIIENIQIECFDLVNFTQKRASPTAQVSGNLQINIPGIHKKRETHVKKTFKLNTFVSILVPYSQPLCWLIVR